MSKMKCNTGKLTCEEIKNIEGEDTCGYSGVDGTSITPRCGVSQAVVSAMGGNWCCASCGSTGIAFNLIPKSSFFHHCSLYHPLIQCDQ